MSNGMELAVKRLVKFDGEGSLRAYCDLVISDTFLVKGLRVVDGKNGLFVSMPRQQTKQGKWFDSVETLTKETKSEVDRIVLDAYREELSTADAVSSSPA